MKALITILAGDGIGPEVMREGVRALKRIAKLGGHEFDLRDGLIGGVAIDASGEAFPDDTRALCEESQAVLLGAVGGPKWSDPNAAVRPEQGLLDLRSALDVYANLRPVATHPALYDASPLKPEKLQGVDILVVRELTGGVYFGEKERTADAAKDVCSYSRHEIERILRIAGQLASKRRGKITSVDKANVMETSRLWRNIADELIPAEFPDLELEHMFIDAATMHLLSRPDSFDVIVTENMFGDILTDEASMLCGSMGMLPSASLNKDRRGLYEPIHGSAPDIAGQGIANPCGMVLSVALMLRYSMDLEQEATLLENTVYAAVEAGHRTADVSKPGTAPISTRAMGDAIIAGLDNS